MDDFIVSQDVLHRPAVFGARASWAAGVRSRLPTAQRDYLEQVQSFLPVPLSWLYLLPAEAKTAAGALHALAQLPLPSACHRCSSLLITANTPIEAITAALPSKPSLYSATSRIVAMSFCEPRS